MMMQRQILQYPLTLPRERQQHFAPVILRPLPSHIPACFQTVHQLDCAVMLNLHPVRQFANARPHSLRHSLDGQHKLILAPFQPGCLYRPLAEMQKLPNLVPKLGQGLIVRQGKPLHAADCIVPRCSND